MDWQQASIDWHRRNGTLARPPAARGAAYDAAGGLPGRRSEPGPNRLGGLDRRRVARDQLFEREDDLGVAPSDLSGGTDDEMSAENLFNIVVLCRAKLSGPEADKFDAMLSAGFDSSYKDIHAIAAAGADRRPTGRAMDRKLAQDRRAVRAAVGELNSEAFLRRFPDARRVSLSGNGR